MPHALEIEPVGNRAFLWRYYDSAIKADVFSTGLATGQGTFLIDPVALAPDAMTGLRGIAGVIVTNENHLRSAAQFANRFQVPVYAEVTVAAGLTGAVPIEVDGAFGHGLTAVPIPGAAIGEIAVHWEEGSGTIVMGDALINFEPYGFTCLPAKYCSNFKLMRSSLAKLLDYSFERMLFAHGTPILSHARERLEALLKARH
jgi:glyoxylase-like metal-dependent hydrolase (beta-lactamase superfamily II)